MLRNSKLIAALLCIAASSVSAQERLIADFTWEELAILAAADGAADYAFESEMELAQGGDEFTQRADRRALIQSLRDEVTRRASEDLAWRAALSSATLSISVDVAVPEFDFDDQVFWFCIPSSVSFRPVDGLANDSFEIGDISLKVDFRGEDSGLYAFVPAMLMGDCSTEAPFRDKYSGNSRSDQYSIRVRHRLPVKFEDEAAAERLHQAMAASPSKLIETRVKCNALENPSEGQIIPRCRVTAIEIGRNPDGSAWFTYTYKGKREWVREDSSVFLFPGATAPPDPMASQEEPSVATGSELPSTRLSKEEVTSIATEILLGEPYGKNETEVRRSIVAVTYATAAPCDEAPAWQVTVRVPETTDADAINGTLAINDIDGKPVCIGLPFLDGVELSTLPLTSPKRSEPVSETEIAPAQNSLPDLLQQVADRNTKAETLSGADRANELMIIRKLLDRVANEYPASNEALSIALGDKVGSVDPVALDAELAAAETDSQEPDLTSETTIDPILATLSICFPQTERSEASDDSSVRVTIRVNLDGEGSIIGMPDFIEPATPDEADRKLFQQSLIALDSCTELKNLNLPAAIEMSLTAAGVDSAALMPGVQPFEPPVLKDPQIAAEDLPESTPEPIWAVTNNVTEKALDLQRDDIAELQVRLGLLGFDPNGVDGVIGRGVRKAIYDWQINRSVPPTGYLDERQITTIKTESQDAFTVWIAEETNADILANASKPPKIEASPSTERAKPPKRTKDCISFEGVTTCL